MKNITRILTLFLLSLVVPIVYSQYSPANYCADAGASDTYACNLGPSPVGYVAGATYYFKANTANTGAATINFNSLGAKTIVKVAGGVTTALADNDILASQVVSVTYDGTNMQMQSLLGNPPFVVVANVGALPATCAVGALAVVTSATLGQQIYQCSAGNVWTQQLNTGSSNGGGITVYSGTGLALSGTLYFPLGGGATPSSTETSVDTDSPSAATITNMYIQLSVALGVGNTGVFTMRKNASSQSVTCTITGNVATSCSDTTHSFNASQGDLLTIQAVFTGTIVVTPNVIIAEQFGTSSSGGTVNAGTAGQVGYYAANGTAITGENLFATNAQTGTYQVLAADFIACKTIPVASGTFTITLVASGSQPASGQCIDIINYGSGVPTLARSGQNINGAAANLTGVAGSSTAPTGWHVVSDGTNYVASLWSAGSSTVACVSGITNSFGCLLEAKTASASASLVFTTCINSTNVAIYNSFTIRIQNMIVGTAGASITWQGSADGGSSYDTGTNYSWINGRFVPGAGVNAGGSGKTYILLDGDGLAAGLATTSTWGLNGNYTLTNPDSTSLFKQIHSDVTQFLENGGARVGGLVTGAHEVTTADNAFRIIPTSGTITVGTAQCYGDSKT